MLISVLCFSKDRPLQLEGYLESFLRYSAEPLSMTVLYKCSPPFDEAYKKLKTKFEDISFVKETSFAEQVWIHVQQVKTPLFMFGCDDVVFKRAWGPQLIFEAFQRLPKLLAFSLRLGREIRYCHPAHRTMSLPKFLETDPFLVWRWTSGELDWGYPWETDCTVYTTRFVRQMLSAIKNQRLPLRRFPWRKVDWGHPNRLEGLGANLIRRRNDSDLMASYLSARASVITINRVQDVVQNPVYDSGLSVDLLLEKWNEGVKLDFEYYKDRSYPSIHVGDVHLSLPA